MIANREKLVSRVFKARYFSQSNIMETSVGMNPSYIWRSLLWSRDIIHSGISWKIGNGLSINTRKDNWIPSLASRKITSNTIYDNSVKVADLIKDSGERNEEKLNNLFLPYETKAINHTDIIGNNNSGYRYWIFEKKGVYSIKSDYREALQEQLCKHCHDMVDITGSCSTKDNMWLKIWA